MSGSLPEPRPRAAFAADARTARAMSAAKALWWTANRAVGRAVVRPTSAPERNEFAGPRTPVSSRRVRQAWLEAFRKDAADVAAGLYPVTEAAPQDPVAAFRRSRDLLDDARQVDARRMRRDGAEARGDQASPAYPAYYRQNFHYQSGGWFTAESAERYEAQVEALFAGAAGGMRRRALSLLARAWTSQDQRRLRILDVACGSGAFLVDLKATFPRANVMGADLSHAYSRKAHDRSSAPVAQASAEKLPYAGASLDGVACIYLFHELPPRVRPVVAREIARVLAPGGLLAFADSIQAADEPGMAGLLEAFPVFFHEPYYESYQSSDLEALFGDAGLARLAGDRAFLTKALLFQKR